MNPHDILGSLNTAQQLQQQLYQKDNRKQSIDNGKGSLRNKGGSNFQQSQNNSFQNYNQQPQQQQQQQFKPSPVPNFNHNKNRELDTSFEQNFEEPMPNPQPKLNFTLAERPPAPAINSTGESTHFYNTAGLSNYMKCDYQENDLGTKQDSRGVQLPYGANNQDNNRNNRNNQYNNNNRNNYSQDRQQQQGQFNNNNNKGMRGQNQYQSNQGGRYYDPQQNLSQSKPAEEFDPQDKHQVFKNKYADIELSQQKEFMLQPDQIYNDGRKYTVLMVAEKPSIAKSIAESLSNGSYNSRRGACKFCQVHEFYGTMFGKNAFFKVTSVIGHIYTTDFPPGYQDWRKIDPKDLFDAPTVKKESNPESNIVTHLQQESLGSSYIVLWLDNDKEGENICYEVLQLCRPNLMKENFMQIYRAKFSSITTKDIKYAFDNLNCGPNINESISVDARQVIDLKIGVAFSRFQTRYLVRKYQELNSKKITFGPCQTPTLAFCVSRDDEIAHFRKEVFYKPIVKCALNQNQTIQLDWTKERTFNQEEAEYAKQEIEQIGRFQVVQVENKEQFRYRPEALNTVVMLKVASQQIGLGPQQTMQIAEKLYLGGFTTYPRTESTRYPKNFDLSGVVNAVHQFKHNRNLSQYANKLRQMGFNQSRAGKDCGDHPPITPTNKTPFNLTPKEQSLYEVISRYFLASISKDAKLYKKKVVFQAGQQQFTIKGTACVDQGFIEVMPWIKVHENEIPNFNEGDVIGLTQCHMHVGHTQPPDHLTESELISRMEEHCIGTDASMATHINNICERDYVQVVGNSRRLVPTQLGKALFHGYQTIDNELIAPDLRSSIERSVDLIAKGQVQYEEVLKNVLELFQNKYSYFVANITKVDQFFDLNYSSIDQAIALAEGFSKCGRCKELAKLLPKVNKLYCEQCKFMYGLPRAHNFEAAQDCFCPQDGYQLILCTMTKNGNEKKISICPLCFQKSPQIEDIQFNKFDRVTCNSCSNNGCNFSMHYNEIANCRHCRSGGRLVLDWPLNGRYTMSCNVCNYQYILCNNGTVYRGRSRCTKCQSYIVKIELIEAERGYRDMQFEGCLFCDEYSRVMQALPPSEEPEKNKHAFLDEELGKGGLKEDRSFQNREDNRGGSRGGRGGRGRGGGRGGRDNNNSGFNYSNNKAGLGSNNRDNNRGQQNRQNNNGNYRGGKGQPRGGSGQKRGRGGGNNNGGGKSNFNYSNNNLQDPMAILRKPIHK